MGYSNVAGDLNVYGTTTLSSLRMNGPINAQGITSTGISNFQNVFASNLTVTNAFIITATNTSVTNALSIVNQGTSTALYVNQNEFPNMVYNVAEFWDHTQLAMVIDGYGHVAVHTASSPGFAFTVQVPRVRRLAILCDCIKHCSQRGGSIIDYRFKRHWQRRERHFSPCRFTGCSAKYNFSWTFI